MPKRGTPILADQQKSLQIKHFEMMLKFCNEHKTLVATLPNSNSLTFLINFIYYKTLLENSSSDSSAPYKRLIELITKKQQKFTEKEKKDYHMLAMNA